MPFRRSAAASSKTRPRAYRYGAWGLCILTLLVLVIVFRNVICALQLRNELPDLQARLSSRIVDRYGQPIQTLLNQNGERVLPLALQDIPENLQMAFIIAEDKRFFSHSGVDGLALSRAVTDSLLRLRVVSGGSTLDMQVARILWPELRSPWLKPAQIYAALKMEKRLRKGEILSLYLNLIPLGHQISGVASGCGYFFAKDCMRLSLAEAATLAVIPRNPKYFTSNKQALIKQRNMLLEKLKEPLHLDDIVLTQAQNEPVLLKNSFVPAHAFHVTQEILEDIRGRETNGEISPKRLATTLENSTQEFAQSLLAQTARLNPASGDAGAILIVDNRRAEILAYVGSPEFFAPDHGMVDGVRARRSPGSALKPFVYLLALQKGLTLADLLPDVPWQMKIPQGVFSPHNYGGNFSGPRQLRFALANSQNLPALQLTSQVGEENLLEFLRAVGFASLDANADFYGKGLSLGNGDVTLWEMTQAYVTLARLGRFSPIHYQAEPHSQLFASQQIFPAAEAYLIADVLSDSSARAEEFGRRGPLEFDYRVAVKTGTSTDYRDHWTVGYTPEYTVAVWRGNADGSPLGARVPAARGSARIFHELFEYLYRQQVPSWYPRPDQIVAHEVCTLSGALPGSACQARRLELFTQASIPSKQCAFHRSLVVADCRQRAQRLFYVELPQNYANWLHEEDGSGPLPTLHYQLQTLCGFDEEHIRRVSLQAKENIALAEPTILEPLNETILAFDPSMPREHQQLRVSFSGIRGKKPFYLFVDGQRHQTLQTKKEVFWPLQKGVHSFQIGDDERRFGSTVKVNVL